MVKPGKIFLVEDEPGMRELVSDFLEGRGYTVEAFGSGRDFLKGFATSHLGHGHLKPIAVISDVNMSPINGLDLLKQIREEHPEVPVILMTARIDREQNATAIREGAFEYLAKPFPLSVLGDVLARALAVPPIPQPAA